MNHNNRFLITGAGGFLGQVISKSLKAKGFTTIGLDLLNQSINIDITKPFEIDYNLNVDVIVHAAGKAHSIPKTEAEKSTFYRVNFEGTKNLCLALEKLRVKPRSFIFISTVAVYGVDSGKMISEKHILNGQTPYAKSKILAENWLIDWADRNGITLAIVRLPLIAGPNPPGNLGAMINGIRTGRYLSIGRAESKKSIVWQEDVAFIIPVLSEIGGIFNLTDGCHPSFRQLETVISQKLGKSPPIKISMFVANFLARIGDLIGPRFPINRDKLNKITSTLTFDDNKARQILGWRPSSVLDKLSDEL